MDSNSVIFKVFLKADDSSEARKFVVDDVSVITSFLYIKGKLAMVFPKLNNVPFKITWKDADGDEITIDSDEDLVMAFTEMSGPVKVLYVTISQPQQESQCRMYNVYCDACNKPITGYRYKCLQCADFDLCSDCEYSGHHKEHYMLRSANGELPFSGMCKRISENINKSIKKAQSMAYKEAHRSAKYAKKHEKKYEHPPKFRCGTEVPVDFCQIPNSVMELINAAVMGYAPEGNASNQNPSNQNSSNQNSSNHNGSNQNDSKQNPQNQQEEEPLLSQESQQQTSQEQPQQQFNERRQQQQPPFVDMIIKALNNIFPAPVSTTGDYPMKAPTPTPTPFAGNEQPQQQQQPQTEHSGPSSGQASGQTSSPMEEDFAFINHDNIPNTSREVPQAPQVPQPTAPLPPLDKKILDGLKQLKDMGFTDHPDLIVLLKRYDGQVGSVIKHIFDNNDIL